MEKLSDSYQSEICCVTMSSSDKIQLVCQPQNDYLFENLIEISKSTVKTTKFYHIYISQMRETFGWHIHEIQYSINFWQHAPPKALTIGRMLIGRIIFHFGKATGWSFLVDGNIKDTGDYLWFVRDRQKMPIYPNKPTFGGFE